MSEQSEEKPHAPDNSMDTAAALGAPYTLYWDEFPYFLSPLVDGIKAKYTAWLKSQAVKDLYESGASEIDRGTIFSMMVTRGFDWGSKFSLASLQDVPGMARMVALLIEEAGGTLLPNEAQALIEATEEQFSALLKMIVRDATPKSRADFLKKAKPPAKA